jgi:hypothetical protein
LPPSNVVGLEVRDQRFEDGVDEGGWQHQADRPGLGQGARQVRQRGGSDRAVPRQRRHRVGVDILHDARVSAAQQPADHVRAHPSDSHHAQLHGGILVQAR